MSTKPSVSQSCNTVPCVQNISMPYNSGWGAVTTQVVTLSTMPRSIMTQDNCDDAGYVQINGNGFKYTGEGGSSWCSVYTVRHSCKNRNWWRRDCYWDVNLLHIGDNVIQVQCVDTGGSVSCGNSSIIITY